ncbi:hypothetical protein [Streptomyces roseolilacinus]|uniref:hypothetical protein n=1 Tax=Streptomyces roseolilacinus TaxID=66904 RepID=UPI0038163FEB
MTTPAGGAAALKATSELLTAARSLIGQVPSADAAEQTPAADQVLDPGGLLSQARQAKRSYQATSRWILAAFAIVGLVLFGSLPFSNISEIEGFDVWLMVIGLGCAAAGIGLAIFAASIVAEPLDASLGALEQRLQPALKCQNIHWYTGPRRRAEINLAKMLTGDEKEAHLGPHMTSISKLIDKLGKLEKARLRLATEATEREETRTRLDGAVSVHLATLVELRQQADDVGKLDAANPNKKGLTGELAERIQKESKAYNTAADKRAEQALEPEAQKQGPAAAGSTRSAGAAALASDPENTSLAATQTHLDTYLGHRTMVLVQSAMMQMRGTFRLARLLMVIGALLTLAGGTLYAYILPAEASSDGSTQDAERQSATAAVVVINKGTDIASRLPEPCVGRAVKALRLDSTVPPRHGPFEVVITDPACPGSITVPKDQGSIDPPAAS